MPALSAPELRRKKSERVAEFKRLSEEYSKDGATPTEEQLTQLNTIFAEVEVGGSFDRQIRAAEMFAAADGIEARGRESAGRQTAPLPHEDPTNTRAEKHTYSLLKAIRESYGWGERNGVKGRDGLTGLEAEVDAELRKRWSNPNRDPKGILVPNSLPINSYAARRGRMAAVAGGMLAPGAESYAYSSTELATTVESTLTGSGSIPTILGTMIDILRTRTVLAQMGVRFMTDMRGNFALPRQATTTTAYWINEGQDVTQSAPTIDQVLFTPHTVGVRTPYTRRFLEQTSVDAENFIREDQAAVKAREIERTALNGTGTSGQPLGMLQNPLIPLIAAGTNGAAPTWANIVAMETTLATANADMGTLGYIIDASVRGLLKTTPKIGSTFPTYLWDGGATPLNEYKVGVTNLLPANLTHGSGTALHAMIFGNWADMLIATWGSDDVIVNPYSADASGSVIITSFSDVDVEVRHPESFVKMMDVLVS
jgi:HK97 family phage major capsid protein